MIPIAPLKWFAGLLAVFGIYLKGKKKGVKKGVNRLAKKAAKRKDGETL